MRDGVAEGVLKFCEFGSLAWLAGAFAITVSHAGGDSVGTAEGGTVLFVHEGFVALDFCDWIFGVRGMAFLAGVFAIALGLVDDAENGFARFFGRLGLAFGIAADTGAIAFPVVAVIGFTIFSFDDA